MVSHRLQCADQKGGLMDLNMALAIARVIHAVVQLFIVFAERD